MTITEEGKVQITPDSTKSAEFFKIVIPPDPTEPEAAATDKAVVIVNPVFKDPEGLEETEVEISPLP